MDEIKQFASNVVPKPRFIFDSYKVQTKPDDNSSDSDGELPEIVDQVQLGLEKITQNKLA